MAYAVKKGRDRLPDTEKNRTEPPAEGGFPTPAAENQPGGVAQPDIPTADREAVDKPGITHDPHEDQIRQVGVADPQGSEGTVAEPQAGPQQHPGPKTPGGKGRAGQPSRRPQNPPLFLGSS